VFVTDRKTNGRTESLCEYGAVHSFACRCAMKTDDHEVVFVEGSLVVVAEQL